MITQFRPRELNAWLAQLGPDAAPVVLDVREPSELAIASIQAEGFTLLTIPMGTVPLRLAELDPQQPIACLCHHGGRSMQVASFLMQHGFEVVNVAGGIHAWSAQVDPSIPVY